MHAYVDNVKKAIEILNNSKKELNELLLPLPYLNDRSNHVLQSLIGGLSFTINAVSGQESEASFKPTPLTHVIGLSVEHQQTDISQAIPTKPDVDDLRERAKEAYANFNTRKNKDLLESLTDLEIRAVAKLAGMDVSITEPAKIDNAFIDKIKAAIKTKNELDEAKQKTV